MNTTGKPETASPLETMRPRERLDRRGARCLSDAELFAVLLDCGHYAEPAKTAARRILDKVNGSIYQLSRWTVTDFTAENLSWKRATALVSALELARRLEERTESVTQFPGPKSIFDFFYKKTLHLDQEKCWIISMDVKGKVLRYDEITTGTASASLFHPRDFLRPAIRCNATKVALVHNHPSGDSTPSSADTEITHRLSKACDVMEISLVDHVIIGRPSIPPHTAGYFSYSNAGML